MHLKVNGLESPLLFPVQRINGYTLRDVGTLNKVCNAFEWALNAVENLAKNTRGKLDGQRLSRSDNWIADAQSS